MELQPFIDWWLRQCGKMFFSMFLFSASLILSMYLWYSTGTFLTLGFLSTEALLRKEPSLGPGEALPPPKVAVVDIYKLFRKLNSKN